VLVAAASVVVSARRGLAAAPACPVPNTGAPEKDTLIAAGSSRRSG